MEPTFAKAIARSSLPHKDDLLQLVRPAIELAYNPLLPEDAPRSEQKLFRAHKRLPQVMGERFQATPQSMTASHSLGRSRLGGLPDLPAGLHWPHIGQIPLSFLAQINLAELPENEKFPAQGLLFFFYDHDLPAWGKAIPCEEAHAGCQVMFVEDARLAERRYAPTELPPGRVLWPGSVEFRMVESLPAWGAPELKPLGLVDEDEAAYREGVAGLGGAKRHQMLGYPAPLQHVLSWDDAQRKHVRAAKVPVPEKEAPRPHEAASPQWELLLQVDPARLPGAYAADGGLIYFTITARDLAARNFQAAWFEFQSA